MQDTAPGKYPKISFRLPPLVKDRIPGEPSTYIREAVIRRLHVDGLLTKEELLDVKMQRERKVEATK